MNPANSFRIWPTTRLWLAVVFILWRLSAALYAQADPQLEFVKIMGSAPGAYGAPVHLGPGEMLGVRVRGLPTQQGIELQVQGLVNRDPGRAVDKNETIPLASLSLANLPKDNAISSNDLVVPLASIDRRGVIEVTARLLAKNGVSMGRPAKLTLDPAASVQAGPSVLKRAATTAATLLDRLLNIYEDVRQGPDLKAVFSVALRKGEAVSPPVQLALERAQFHALAISPSGNHLAWVTQGPVLYDLWSSDLEKITPVKIASSDEVILTPRFADENLLVYVTKSTLFTVSTEKPEVARAVQTPLRSVAGIDRAERKEGSIECIVRGEPSDALGLNLPHLARISVGDSRAQVFRLPMNPFYQSYSLLVEGVPFFYAGTVDGVEGIYSFKPDDPDGPVTILFKIPSPGLVALAANGSRLVFVGAQ